MGRGWWSSRSSSGGNGGVLIWLPSGWQHGGSGCRRRTGNVVLNEGGVSEKRKGEGEEGMSEDGVADEKATRIARRLNAQFSSWLNTPAIFRTGEDGVPFSISVDSVLSAKGLNPERVAMLARVSLSAYDRAPNRTPDGSPDPQRGVNLRVNLHAHGTRDFGRLGVWRSKFRPRPAVGV